MEGVTAPQASEAAGTTSRSRGQLSGALKTAGGGVAGTNQGTWVGVRPRNKRVINGRKAATGNPGCTSMTGLGEMAFGNPDMA